MHQGFGLPAKPHDSLTMSPVFRTIRRGGASGCSVRSMSVDAARLPISSRDTVVTFVKIPDAQGIWSQRCEIP